VTTNLPWAWSRNHRFSRRSKHIKVHFYFIQERDNVDYIVKYVSSGGNIADVYTKIISRPVLSRRKTIIS
jgi:hypothetical protein